MIRPATAADAREILDIYAPYVESSPVTFEVAVPPLDEFTARVEGLARRYAWLVYEIDGRIVGYAHSAPHRAREGYKWSTDVAIYVRPEAQRRGVARALYERLFAEMKARGFRNLFAGVALPNPASVGLHESLGFIPIGVYRKVGWKLGRWIDVGWWQKEIGPYDDAPVPPVIPD